MMSPPSFRVGDRVRLVGGHECPNCVENVEALFHLMERGRLDSETLRGTVTDIAEPGWKWLHEPQQHLYGVQWEAEGERLGSWRFAAWELELAEGASYA